MDHQSRLIGLAFVVLWTIFRLVRYFRAGTSRRPGPAVPQSAGLGTPQQAAPPVAATPATASPIDPIAGSRRGPESPGGGNPIS
jgi:hypothetical protein